MILSRPLRTVESNGMHGGDFILLSPKVELNEVHQEDCSLPPLAMELNGVGVESFTSRTTEELNGDVRPLDAVSTVSPDVTWASSRTERVAPTQTAGGGATLHAISRTLPAPPDVRHVSAPAMPPGPLPVPPSP